MDEEVPVLEISFAPLVYRVLLYSARKDTNFFRINAQFSLKTHNSL